MGAKDVLISNSGITPKGAPTTLFRAAFTVIAALFFVLGNAQAQAAPESLHGADGIFVSPDVAIVWAVLKQPSGDKATVWLRIVNSTRKFSHVAVEGVDPFTKKREPIEVGIRLEASALIASDRDTFSDLPSREVQLYRSAADLRASKPTLTVYYLGVPDTTPEFSTRAAMDEYFKTVRLVAHKVEAKP